MENDRYNDFSGILTFVSGALIVLALLMSCFLVWRATVWLRDRMDVDGGAVEGQIDPLDEVKPRDPWDQAISRPAADYNWNVDGFDEAGCLGGLGGMNQREQEELLLFAGTRKQRKAIKQRRSSEQRKAMKERWKAREQAQKKQQSDS
jgi:hypothetical protein